MRVGNEDEWGGDDFCGREIVCELIGIGGDLEGIYMTCSDDLEWTMLELTEDCSTCRGIDLFAMYLYDSVWSFCLVQ